MKPVVDRVESRRRLAQLHPADRFRAMFGEQVKPDWTPERPHRIYISGPMTGLPDLNFPAFARAAELLREKGWEPVNPAEVKPIGGTEWEHYMRGDIRALCECEALALLDGWETSKGAHLEVHIAHRLGLEVFRIEELLSCPTANPPP